MVTLVICAIFAAARIILPAWLCDIIIIIVIGAGMLWAYRIYSDISSRDKSDFDRVNPNKLISSDTLIQPTTAGNAAGGISGAGDAITSPVVACSGNECCDINGTIWDSTKLKCVIKTPFTTLDTAYSTLILPQDGLSKRQTYRSGTLE